MVLDRLVVRLRGTAQQGVGLRTRWPGCGKPWTGYDRHHYRVRTVAIEWGTPCCGRGVTPQL